MRSAIAENFFVRSATAAAHLVGNPPLPTPRMNADETDLTTLLDRIERGETDLYLQVVRRHELMLRGYP